MKTFVTIILWKFIPSKYTRYMVLSVTITQESYKYYIVKDLNSYTGLMPFSSILIVR